VFDVAAAREGSVSGKPLREAVHSGFARVWATIFGTHGTALIAAALLFQFGTGAI